MKIKKLNARKPQKRNGHYAGVHDALLGITSEQWTQLAKLGERLLIDLRIDARLARYLAGSTGEDLVNTAVMSIQVGAMHHQEGRACRDIHLADSDAFVSHLKQIIRSVANNYRRHRSGQFAHVAIHIEEDGAFPCEPVEPTDIRREVSLRDLLNVLVPRVTEELQGKPKQLAVFQEWVRLGGEGSMLPDVHSKFVRFCVRQIIIKHLKALAMTDLKLRHSTGKELLF
jgi:hypothetical protein